MVDTTNPENILAQIASILEQRKQADPEGSYAASLFEKGEDAILKKLGEEAVETILAAKSNSVKKIVYESADLWFHTLLMLSHYNIQPSAVLNELLRRFGTSGIEEKRSRKTD